MTKARDERLFARSPGEIPEWMAIRDEDNKRRKANQDRLRAARLARDAIQLLEGKTTGVPRRRTGPGKRQEGDHGSTPSETN